VQLERQAAYGAAIAAVGHHDALSVAGEQREHLLDRVVDSLPCRFEELRPDAVAISCEHGEQQILLAGKVVVEAPAVRGGLLQHVGDARARVAFFGEESHGGVDQTRAGIGGFRSHALD